MNIMDGCLSLPGRFLWGLPHCGLPFPKTNRRYGCKALHGVRRRYLHGARMSCAPLPACSLRKPETMGSTWASEMQRGLLEASFGGLFASF